MAEDVLEHGVMPFLPPKDRKKLRNTCSAMRHIRAPASSTLVVRCPKQKQRLVMELPPWATGIGTAVMCRCLLKDGLLAPLPGVTKLHLGVRCPLGCRGCRRGVLAAVYAAAVERLPRLQEIVLHRPPVQTPPDLLALGGGTSQCQPRVPDWTMRGALAAFCAAAVEQLPRLQELVLHQPPVQTPPDPPALSRGTQKVQAGLPGWAMRDEHPRITNVLFDEDWFICRVCPQEDGQWLTPNTMLKFFAHEACRQVMVCIDGDDTQAIADYLERCSKEPDLGIKVAYLLEYGLDYSCSPRMRQRDISPRNHVLRLHDSHALTRLLVVAPSFAETVTELQIVLPADKDYNSLFVMWYRLRGALETAYPNVKTLCFRIESIAAQCRLDENIEACRAAFANTNFDDRIKLIEVVACTKHPRGCFHFLDEIARAIALGAERRVELEH